MLHCESYGTAHFNTACYIPSVCSLTISAELSRILCVNHIINHCFYLPPSISLNDQEYNFFIFYKKRKEKKRKIDYDNNCLINIELLPARILF